MQGKQLVLHQTGKDCSAVHGDVFAGAARSKAGKGNHMCIVRCAVVFAGGARRWDKKAGKVHQAPDMGRRRRMLGWTKSNPKMCSTCAVLVIVVILVVLVHLCTCDSCDTCAALVIQLASDVSRDKKQILW